MIQPHQLWFSSDFHHVIWVTTNSARDTDRSHSYEFPIGQLQTVCWLLGHTRKKILWNVILGKNSQFFASNGILWRFSFFFAFDSFIVWFVNESFEIKLKIRTEIDLISLILISINLFRLNDRPIYKLKVSSKLININ